MARTKPNTTINGNKYHRISRTVNGKRKQFYGKTKMEAERKYLDYLEKIARDSRERSQEADTVTFGDRAEEYVNEVLIVSQKYAKGTITNYERAYRLYVKDSQLANIQLKDLRPSDVQRFYNGLDVSQQTMSRIAKFMSVYCKWLQLNGYAQDFLSAVEIPKKYDNSFSDEIVIWSDDEIRAILDGLDAEKPRHRQKFMVYVLLYTGMRISEVLALKYSDIKSNVIHVERQWYLNEIKPPKWNSKRQIPMHRDLVRAYQEHRKWHKAEMEKKQYLTDYVFTTSNGNLYNASSVRKALVRFCDRIGIEYKHIHVFRATFCTQMCRCGVPLEVTSKLMGHKSLEVTAKHYALVRKESLVDAVESLNYR